MQLIQSTEALPQAPSNFMLELTFTQWERVQPFMKRDEKALLDSKFFLGQKEDVRKVMREKPPYLVYRHKKHGWFCFIEEYQTIKTSNPEPVMCAVILPPLWNRSLKMRKPKCYSQTPPELLEPVNHRQVLKETFKRNGIHTTIEGYLDKEGKF